MVESLSLAGKNVTKKLTIDYEPRNYQWEVHDATHRFKVVVFHRQAGKTTMAINELIKAAAQEKGTYFYIAPTYRMAKQIAWDMLKTFLPRDIVRKQNESELLIEIANGSKIFLKGADNPDSLRGVTLKGAVLDEYGFMKSEVWDAIIRPTLLTTDGWALFIGTPAGKNHFFEHYMRGKDPEQSDWISFQQTIRDTNILSEEQIESIKQQTTEEFFQQEYECAFLEGAGSVFRRIKENVTDSLKEPLKQRHYVMGVDLGKAMDWTVITVLDRHTHEVVHIDRFNKIDWEFQATRIEACARKFNNAQVWIDSTGKGDPVADNLQRKGVAIRRFEYTNKSKKELIENLILKFEYDAIKIPKYQPLIDELEIFTYEISPKTRRIIYNAPVGYHDDCVNSLALACWKLGEKLPAPQRQWGVSLNDPLDAFNKQHGTAYQPQDSITGY